MVSNSAPGAKLCRTLALQELSLTFKFMHLADALIKREFFFFFFFYQYVCGPWELNPRPFVLLMQCCTTEPVK